MSSELFCWMMYSIHSIRKKKNLAIANKNIFKIYRLYLSLALYRLFLFPARIKQSTSCPRRTVLIFKTCVNLFKNSEP